MPRASGAPAPSLSRSNNSIEDSENEVSDPESTSPAVPVSKGAYKTEFYLKMNVELAANLYGLGTWPSSP